MTDQKHNASKAIVGLQWSFISVVITSIFQIVYSAIMARLIVPEAFGLIAMANLVLRFGIYFSRMGISSALIQKKELTPEDIRAGFSVSVIFGSTVTLILIVAAPLAKILFDTPDVIPVVQALSLSLFVNSFSATALGLLQRELRMRKIAIAEIGSFLLGNIMIGIPLAYFGFGVWGLILATLSQSVFLAVFAYAFSHHTLRPTLDFRLYQPLLGFGSKVSLISFLEFLCYNLPSMAMGRFLGAEMLGYYNRASTLVKLPAEKLSSSLTKVLFPSLSRVQDDRMLLRHGYRVSFTILGTFLFLFGFIVSASAQEIILVILGLNWETSISLLRILAIAVPFSLVRGLGGILLEAIAFLRQKIFIMAGYLLLLIIFLFQFSSYGVIGYAFAVLLCDIVFFIIYQIFILRICAFSITELIRMILGTITPGLVGYVVIFSLQKLLGPAVSLRFLFAFELLVSLVLVWIFYYCFPMKDLKASLLEILPKVDIHLPFLRKLKDKFVLENNSTGTNHNDK